MDSKNKRKVLFIAFATILILFIFNIKVDAAEAFTLTKTNVDVELNSNKYIGYQGGSGNVTWRSEDQTIATVENGKITGKKIGTTNIIATSGNENATCKVNVIYGSITITANSGNYVKNVDLYLKEHETEKLIATVKDGKNEKITDPVVAWKSDNTSVVTVDTNTGTLKAVKEGTATITATSGGISATCEVTVHASPKFTDFSKAEYKMTLNGYTETLQITGIELPDLNKTFDSYYYIITPNNTKFDIIKKDDGDIDPQAMNKNIENLIENEDENYLYSRSIGEYVELNQDMYIWILQKTHLDDSSGHYYDENGKPIYYAIKFIVEGKKLERPQLPQLNLILQSFHVGEWESSTTDASDNYTWINFNFPTATPNRKFTIKIGKVTDNAILTKIKNNDYSGITDLLSYAKKNNAVYTQNLTTTREAYFRSDSALFDGKKLLENKAYYYVYVKFDDENGKYYPIEGVTLGQAYISSSINSWSLYAYTTGDFKWDNLTPSTGGSTSGNKRDETVANSKLPQTGVTSIIILSAIASVALGGFFYIRYNKYKDIK